MLLCGMDGKHCMRWLAGERSGFCCCCNVIVIVVCLTRHTKLVKSKQAAAFMVVGVGYYLLGTCCLMKEGCGGGDCIGENSIASINGLLTHFTLLLVRCDVT